MPGRVFNFRSRINKNRDQSSGEEIANSISHGIGLLAALIGIPFLLQQTARTGDRVFLVANSIFLSTIVLLYLTSTLYHALPKGKAKHVFRITEHIAIFYLIAGTYTSFTLGILRGPWGWTFFGLTWALALMGVVLKLTSGVRHPVISTTHYLLMGWVIVIAVRPLWLRLSHMEFVWIFLGGLAYTGGVVFYALDSRMRYSHFIWHLFVMTGTVLHYFAVYWYAGRAV
ncbi:MAG: hemolysin III family protein [Elusimicrobiota bacterium]|jgi:hemolysin III